MAKKAKKRDCILKKKLALRLFVKEHFADALFCLQPIIWSPSLLCMLGNGK
jgi:hypothetical protein